MWTNDEYPSARYRQVVRVFSMEKLVDSEEFDLGMVNITDLELELAEPELTQIPTGPKSREPRAMPDHDDAVAEFLS
jgi:hypothetical protein